MAIDFLEGVLPNKAMQLLITVADEEPTMSIITKIETLGFNFQSIEEQNTINSFVNGSSVLDINDAIVNQTITLRKLKKIKLPDAIIAATALVYDLILITRNAKDFTAIDGLKIIDPHSL